VSGWFARETESHLYEKAFRKIVLNFAPEFLEKNDGRKKQMKQTTNIIYPTFALLALACFALSPKTQAVVPAPDGGYAGGNTAEGQNARLTLTTGTYNTALGLYSLLSDSIGTFNTAVGAGTLLVNTADENTATGAAALLSNTSGEFNTANGAFALFNNTAGDFSTVDGDQALFNNTIDDANTADGYQAPFFNTAGTSNTANGTVQSNAIALPLSKYTHRIYFQIQIGDLL
jgi:hypothetical protein